jgi:uncharacterized protein (TIGR02996 family)
MADMMAIVSKAVFEKAAGKSPAVGTKLAMDRYVSANKNLEKLAEGGKLYLVTVRPPDEALWLVAVLDRPKFDGKQWKAKASDTPITDITHLRSELVFESGKGITAAKGALGMSLQTPRAVTAEDVELLDAAVTDGGGSARPKAARGDEDDGEDDGDDEADPGPPPPPPVIEPAGDDRRSMLLAAVLNDPTNDEPRKVYADELSTENDPRGEFILIDIALGGPLSIRKRALLSARRAELLTANRKTWWGTANVRTRHGFAEALSGRFKQIAAKLFDSDPIVEIGVGIDDDAEIDKLVAAKWFPRVRRLIIHGPIGDDGFGTLVGARQTAYLQSLNVTANEIGADGMSNLEPTALPSLTTLVLSGNPIGDEGLEALAAWKRLPAVEALYLSECEISGDGIATLLGGAPLAKLEKLTLSNNSELGDDIGAVLTKHASKLPALRHLELKNSDLGTASVKGLAKAKLPALRRIDVRRNGIEDSVSRTDPRIRV